MYRSVTESRRQGGKRRAIYWLEGIGVGLAVFLLVFLVIGWG